MFISGLGDDSHSWEYVQCRISQITSTFSYDRAGVGRSGTIAVSRTCLDLVEELYDLIRGVPVESPFILVGHSFGGLVARLFASRHPLLVSGIVLVDAAPEYKELAYEKVLPKNRITTNREYYENPMLNSEKIDKIQSYKQISAETWLGDIPLSILTRGLPDKEGGDWPHQAILEIEQNQQLGFRLHSNLSRHRIAEGSGHYIHQDEPEIVIEEIIRMLEGREI